MKRNPMHDAGPIDEDLKSHAERPDDTGAPPETGGDARALPPTPHERRKVRHPGKDEPNEDRPESEQELADEAARRYTSSSANKELEQDPDRGMEGGKIQRNQEDRITREGDRTPPARGPQDDIA